MDLGDGALGALQRYAGLYAIDAVCLSHLHGDHCLDLCSYSVARLYHRTAPMPRIPVYGPSQAEARLGQALAADRAGRGRPRARDDRRVQLRDAHARHHRDRPAADHGRADEPPGGDVRLPDRARRAGAGLLGGHRPVRRAGRPGPRRGLPALRGVVPRRRRRPANCPRGSISPGGRPASTPTGPGPGSSCSPTWCRGTTRTVTLDEADGAFSGESYLAGRPGLSAGARVARSGRTYTQLLTCAYSSPAAPDSSAHT